MLPAIRFPTEHAHRRVRIGDIAKSLLHGFHSAERFVIRGPVPPDFALHVLEPIAAEIEKAWKIVGAANVHGVGEGWRCRSRMKFSGAQIFGHDIVGIGRRNETWDGQPYALGEDSRRG